LRTADPQHDWQTDLQLELIAEALIDALEQIAPRHELIVRKLGKR
jgi:hypothetical protein